MKNKYTAFLFVIFIALSFTGGKLLGERNYQNISQSYLESLRTQEELEVELVRLSLDQLFITESADLVVNKKKLIATVRNNSFLVLRTGEYEIDQLMVKSIDELDTYQRGLLYQHKYCGNEECLGFK